MPEKPLILTVDDDCSMLKLLRRTLALEGFRVVTAANGHTSVGKQGQRRIRHKYLPPLVRPHQPDPEG